MEEYNYKAALVELLTPLYASKRKFKVLRTPEELIDAVFNPKYTHRNRDERLRLLFRSYTTEKRRGESWKHYLLRLVSLKQCNSCDKVQPYTSFSKEHRSGYQSQCKNCRNDYTRNWQKDNKGRVNAKTRNYQARKLNATPSWANLTAIEEFYKECPEGYEVDHVIPLQGNSVCGLHVLDNLQYLTVQDNRAKSNNYEH